MSREQRDEYCFLVIGKSGNGKSRLSNAIAGDSKFPVGRGMVATTRRARLETVYTSRGNIQVVDTPDITNCGMNNEEMRQEVSEWRRLTQPYSTTAILTVRCDVRYTAEEYAIYTKIAELWGGSSLRKKLVVAFTFGECQDNPLEEELKTVCKELKSVLRDANDTWFLVDYTKGDDFRGKAIDAAARAAQGRPRGTEAAVLVSALIAIAVFSRRFITAIVLYSLGTAPVILQKSYEVTCDIASFVYRGVGRVVGWMMEKVFGSRRECDE